MFHSFASRRSFAAAFGLIALAVSAVFSQTVDTLPLRIGDAFPRLAVEAISGRAIIVPDSRTSVPTVVIVSFSREAGKDAQHWDELLAAERSSGQLAIVLIAEIQSVPRLIRGTVSYAIRHGVPQALRDRMVVLDRDENIWKRRLAVTSTDEAYVVLVDSSGNVAWTNAGRSPEASVEQLRDVVRRLPSRRD